MLILIIFGVYGKPLLLNQLNVYLLFRGRRFFMAKRGSLLSFVSEFMECILEMDFLWQDFIPHIVET